MREFKNKPIVNVEETRLEECLSLFTDTYILDENNKVLCDKCSEFNDRETKTTTSITSSFEKLPKVLIFHLKRFFFQQSGKIGKIETVCTFPHELVFDDLSEKRHYKLFSIVKHCGTLDRGHYSSLTKIKDEWFYFSDTNIIKSRAEDLHNIQPYLLFYYCE